MLSASRRRRAYDGGFHDGVVFQLRRGTMFVRVRVLGSKFRFHDGAGVGDAVVCDSMTV